MVDKKVNNVLYCKEGKFNPLFLNAIYFDKRSPYERQIPMSIKTHGMWYYVLCIIYAIIRDILKIILKYPVSQWCVGYKSYASFYQGKIVFHAITTNNIRSLERTYRLVCSCKENVFLLDSSNYYQRFPRVLAFFKSIASVPMLYSLIKGLSPRDKRIVGYYIPVFFRSTGFAWCCYNLLTKYRPESVIMANDHSYNRKAIALICEDLGIKTIYIQHASVSYAFPELHFSFSFLDGLDSFEKYIAEGKNVYGQVVLLGAVRYDRLSDYRMNRDYHRRNCLGIAINKLDDFSKVSDFCSSILSNYLDISIKIRSHPSIKKNPLKILASDRFFYTNANDESIIDYFDSIDAQISGDSGIHFDAIIAGVPTLAYNFTSKKFGDNYKYVEKGLIRYATDINQVFIYLDDLKLMKSDSDLIRYYDESYEKNYAGHCSNIVAGYIINGYNVDYLRTKYSMELKTYKDKPYLVIPQ